MKLLVAGLVAGLLTTSVAALASTSTTNDDPFDRARQAASEISFTGTLEVRWLDGAAEHHEQLTVQSAEGSMLLKGGNLVMVSSTSERLVQHPDGGWNLLWPPALERSDGPDIARKYQTTEHDGSPVAGRTTTVVDVRQGRLLREQVSLDRETDLLLERRQFDEQGATTRVVGFTALTIDPTTAPPPPPAPADRADQAPEIVSPAHLPSASTAPARLADGYERVGVYKRDGVVQVLYSDGIYDLSVFERTGALDRHQLGQQGGPVAVGKAAGWRYAWPGGQVVLWQAGSTVYTVVSDAPLDQVLTAARALPVPAKKKPSAMERLRSVARTLIQPLEP